ncbi:hypothetical protein N7492_005827 [Penicillium capsulatum]|uniref:Uncharacterized protein n=1 Tax=Penicillium capsulatum TaxID=69766 RepID=A0A9W9IA57_9EURO|nr:hypothetical protein N7492_005827 [Penicillium capsulatum]KAJ6135073.1 hypothetical protein N7512_000233 [Penicillium capsulatum]
MSSSPEEVQPTPGTSPQELYYEQTRPEPSSPSPAPTRPTHLSRHAPTIPARAPTIRIVQFLDVTAHTAKCDDCDRRNREGMIRCCICGWQCCRNCQNSRGGSRTHRSFQSIHVASQAEADEADQNVAANALVRMNKGPATTPSSRTTRSPLLQRARDASIDGNRESDETVSVSEDSADDLGLWKFGGGRRNPPRGARPEGYAD